jgi:hypothetical protein
VLQGTWTYVLQDAAGNIELTHSVSAGLDYAAIGPEHAMLREQGRVSYRYATDDEALQAFAWLARSEACCRRSSRRTRSPRCATSPPRSAATGSRRQSLGPRRQGRPSGGRPGRPAAEVRS